MALRRSQTSRKKQDKQRKRREKQRQLRTDIERMLVAMELHDLIKITRMPDEHLHRLTSPKPMVLPAPGQAHDTRLSRLVRELKKKLNHVTVTVGGIDITFNDYWAIGFPLAASLIRNSSASSNDESEFSTKVFLLASAFSKRFDDQFYPAYSDATIDFLADHSRFDACLYSARQIPPSESLPTFSTILIKHPPETASILYEGAKRQAFRCGAPADLVTGEITWVSWAPGTLGWGEGRPLPVYIQSHAILQAGRRLRIHDQEDVLQYLIWESLRAPRLTRLDDGGFLIDLRVNDEKRVGYLVGSRLPDRVLIKTFLLPTMQGTPESRELHRRLRLRRPDIEYLGLDDLRVLAATDLLRDPETAKIFQECGLGDLLRFASEDYRGEIRSGYSKRFKAYLGLSSTLTDQVPIRDLGPTTRV